MQFEPIFKVSLFSHYFKVYKLTPRAQAVLLSFLKGFIQTGLVRKENGRFRVEPVKVFAASTKNRQEFRFHINQYSLFLEHLSKNHITPNLYEVKQEPLYEPVKIDVKLKENWVLRDYQVPAVDYLLDEKRPASKFIDLQTGRGKTLVSLAALSKIGLRTVVLIKPMYIDKWAGKKGDILDKLDIDLKETMVVQGSAHLKGLIALAKEGNLNAKFIVISNKTFQNYINTYEDFPNDLEALGYDCPPDKFFETIGAGVRLVDEVHQDAHLNFKIDLYTNIPLSIALSATLLSHDDFLTRMYEIMHPQSTRYKEEELDKYISAYAMFYKFKDYVKIQTKEVNSPVYSHHVFERSVMKQPKVQTAYFDMVNQIAQDGYFKDYQKGDKLAIFVSSIKMATRMTEYFKKKYPSLKVNRYVQDDPYENLLDSDIRITTILSGGTAHDIPNLTTTILTIAVDSIQANIQTLGRLRRIKDRKLRFYYLVNESIDKHKVYHERRKKMLLERAESFKELFFPKYIG